MMVTNWHKHPKADITFGTWNNVTVTANGDGTRTYSTANVGAFFPFQNMSCTKITTSSFVVAVRFREARADQVERAAAVLRNGEKDGIWAYSGTQDLAGEAMSYPAFLLAKGSLTPIALAIYTPEDWERLQSMGVTLFDGDTMPLA
ncbi:hypothetical protein ACJ4Z0_09880 [Bifidobacterium catenulatum]|uniref:hypothetical protein n=1 Tax=Bifidobacterium catenulatum TaxID=1686 RepID=UPI003D3446B6